MNRHGKGPASADARHAESTSSHARHAGRALLIGLLNWIAWGLLIGSALLSDYVIPVAMFGGVFLLLGSLISCCVGLLSGFLALKAEDRRDRRKAWTGVALILLLGPTLWMGYRVGYGSTEWTEEVRLAGGEVVLVHRRNLNGPGEFMHRCTSCVDKATFSGEHRGRRFRWSTDSSKVRGVGPLALEFIEGDPLLVLDVSGEAECSLHGWPDPPFRVIRLERRRWLPDRWVESSFEEVPKDAQVNLLGLRRVPRLALGQDGGILTSAAKDHEQGYDAYNPTPHGARLSAVGKWLSLDPDSCKNRGRAPSGSWLASRRATLESESNAEVASATLIERSGDIIDLSADQVRERRGVTGPVTRTRGCRESGVRVATLGDWVASERDNADGELEQSDVLVAPLEFGGESTSWVLPGPLKDYRQIVCLPDRVMVLREPAANTFLLTRLGGSATKPVSRRITVDVPAELEGKVAFWTVADDGRELQMAAFQDDQYPALGRMDPRELDRLIEYRGVRLNLLRYRVP